MIRVSLTLHCVFQHRRERYVPRAGAWLRTEASRSSGPCPRRSPAPTSCWPALGS